MDEVNRWPIDFESLNKGDSIPPEKLEEITGCNRGTTDYQFAVLALQQRIMDELEDRGKPATVAFKRNVLRVLTDSEALEHNAKSYSSHIKGLRRDFGRMMNIETANLSDREKVRYEREIEIEGKVLQSIDKTRKQFRISAHKRDTPVPAIN